MSRGVTCSAPGKLMLFGEHAVVYGRPCIVTAVDQRMRATISLRADDLFHLEAEDVQLTGYEKSISELGKGKIPRGAAFVERAVQLFCEHTGWAGGVSVEMRSEFSALFGFGSSSASTVAVLSALNVATESGLATEMLFDIAYKTVLAVQGKGSGFDIAAAAWGGTLWFVAGGEEVEPLNLRGASIVIGYSGIKADTVTLMEQVRRLAQQDPALVESVYDSMGDVARSARRAIDECDWKTLGSLMDINQSLLASLGVSTAKLDAMIGAARAAGAYGAKLSGAGGGDCMIALVPVGNEQPVQAALAAVGGVALAASVQAPGVRLE